MHQVLLLRTLFKNGHLLSPVQEAKATLLFGPVPRGTLFVAEAVRQPPGGHCPQISAPASHLGQQSFLGQRSCRIPSPGPVSRGRETPPLSVLAG